ncbi:MAG: glycoside hydrolase family 3 protein, partial [Actinobacteria bacterium]|nr:glycoside hydrolase family 3 protein [Actinomycetota bacterium]
MKFPARTGIFATRTGAVAVAVAMAAAVLPASGGSTIRPVSSVSVSVPAGGAQAVFNRMTEAQRIGQLFMVGAAATGAGQSTLTAIGVYHVGNVILTGRSSLGVTATRSVVDGLQKRATA